MRSSVRHPLAATSCTSPSSTTQRSATAKYRMRSEEHTSELQSHLNLVCRLLLEKKKISQTDKDKTSILLGEQKYTNFNALLCPKKFTTLRSGFLVCDGHASLIWTGASM